MDTTLKAKFVTPEVAVQSVQSGDWVDYGFGAGFPELLDKALAARKGEVKDVKVRGGLVIRPRIEIVESDPEQESFSYYSWHIGDYERKLQTQSCALCRIFTAISTSAAMWRLFRFLLRMRRVTAALVFPTMHGARSSRAPARLSSRSTSTIPSCRA